MLSLPEDWDYTTKGLARICRDGVDSICATVRELEDAGYIIRERVRNANGRLGSIEYTILEQPRQPEPKPENPERENPVQVKPVLDSPVLGKPEQDTSGEIPRYLVFFKGRDADVITAAFREFSAKNLEKEKKPSIRKELEQAKQQAKAQHHQREKVKAKDRGVEL